MKKKVLVLCPHPDDAEFSCGGTIAKYTEAGAEVHYIVFSKCSKSLPGNLPEDILYQEIEKAAQHLGVKHNHIVKYDFPVRDFPAHRQEILELLVEHKKKINPGLVLLPGVNDIHQDHQVIHSEGIRAFKDCSILGYELPWNNVRKSEVNYYIKLTVEQVEKKLNAINEYKSQQFREYMDSNNFRVFAQFRGSMVNAAYAEGFELIRWIES